ncbi:MAG: hypothetical protein WC413_04130 [Candidatus Nanoarchaeia archaeon]
MVNRRQFLELALLSTIPHKMKGYENVNLTLVKRINTNSSPKSVEFNPEKTKAYINNLEDGSIYVFNTKDYSLETIIKYQRTFTNKTRGNYNSFEEKPVETCLRIMEKDYGHLYTMPLE